jgi:DNA polymerase-1
MGKKLVLVDGHALAYRAFFALPIDAFSTSRGELTNAVYGFTRMLLRALEQEKPDYIAVTFDAGKETFRHQEFKEYKAQRARMPEEMRDQMARIVEVIEALGIPIFEVEGYEADDLIGTLSKQAQELGVETLILTGDYDAFQLVSPRVKVLTTGGHRQPFSEARLFDEKALQEKYDFRPSLLVDYKALVGDASDNIPGVPGIGPKYATDLVNRYGTIEEIYEHLEETEPTRVRNALAEGKEQAFLSKRLATIVTDVPIALDLERCRTGDYDRDRVMELFRKLEFRSLVDRLPKEQKAEQLMLLTSEEKEALDYHVVTTKKALERVATDLSRSSHLTLDVETTGTDAMSVDLVGLALTTEPGGGYYIPLGHLDPEGKGQLPLEEVRAALAPILKDDGIAKWAHNAIYDLMVLRRHGLEVQGLAFDTMIAAYLLDPGGRGFGLKNLAWRKLGIEMTPISELIGKGRDQKTMALVPIAAAAPYAVADVEATERLARLLEAELKEHQLWDLFVQVEIPLVEVLLVMEMAGVALDIEHLKQMSRELYLRITALEREIYEMAGHPFNVSSTQQLSSVLFEELELPAKARTKTGYSTSAGVLEELRGMHPIIELVLEYRQLSKLKSTYLDALPLLVNPRTGRVHTSYNQTGTVTGRISSSNPNLQNIPIRTEIGRQVRRAFIAEEGCLLLSADYSQVELRIMAHISQDPGLLSAFERGEDIHASTAATVMDLPLSQVTPEMRRIAKSINFGLSYGMGAYGLAQRTGLSQEEAAEFIANYFARYPKVQEYIEETKRVAREKGYVSTLLGRRRYFPELQSTSRAHGRVKRAAERMAINMPIQGSAADILKIAMIRLHGALQEKGLASRLTLQVHDELVLEVPGGELKTVAPLVRSVMEGAYELRAPLKVDIKVGKNWEEMSLQDPVPQGSRGMGEKS